MPAVKSIFDLFVRGKNVVLTDGDNSFTVWIQKLSPVEQEKALRRANGVKTAQLALLHSDREERYERSRADLANITDSRASMIDWLATLEAEAKRVVFAEKAQEQEPWDADKVQGLYDAWRDELHDRWVKDDEKTDEEAQAVFAEITEFETLVDNMVQAEFADFQMEFNQDTDAELYEKIVDKLIDLDANQAWYLELRMCYVWLGTRDPENHRNHLFQKREDVDQLPAETLRALLEAYDDVTVGVTEGKSSQEEAAS